MRNATFKSREDMKDQEARNTKKNKTITRLGDKVKKTNQKYASAKKQKLSL